MQKELGNDLELNKRYATIISIMKIKVTPYCSTYESLMSATLAPFRLTVVSPKPSVHGFGSRDSIRSKVCASLTTT